MTIVRFVAKQLPGERDSGGRQRAAAFVQEYARHFDRVVVYGYGHGSFDEDNVEVRPFELPSLRPTKVATASSFVAKWHSRALSRALASDLRPQDFIHVDFPQMAINLPRRSLPDVVDFHNIESALMRSRTSTWPEPKRAAARFESARLASFEFSWARRARIATACSVKDVQTLRDNGARALLVPNGVSSPPTAFTPPPGVQNALFLGSMDYGPNIEAAEWFVQAVWPLVLERLPTATVTLAGRHANRLAPLVGAIRGVVILDSPPELAPVYARADVCVVPLLSGAGTKIKLLEAAAHGRPVVSTTVGLEGLEELAQMVSRADQPRVFSAAVVAALTSGEVNDGRVLFEHARRNFSWPARTARLGERLTMDRKLGIV